MTSRATNRRTLSMISRRSSGSVGATALSGAMRKPYTRSWLTALSQTRTMFPVDVRLSPEQRALQAAAAQMAERLGPRTVRDLDERERAAKLDASVASSGWRELRGRSDAGGPWTSAVEVAIVTEQFARGLVDASFIGP